MAVWWAKSPSKCPWAISQINTWLSHPPVTKNRPSWENTTVDTEDLCPVINRTQLPVTQSLNIEKPWKIHQRQCLVGFKLRVEFVSKDNSPLLTINEHFCRSIQMLHSLNWDETLCNLHLKSDLQISEGMRFVLSSTISLFCRDHNSQNNAHGVKI